MVQVLTLTEVKAAARDAYCKKLLTAQYPKEKQRKCVYEYDGKYHCAVGAALTEETIKAIYKAGYLGATIEKVFDDGLVKIESNNELDKIRKIQNAHDTWANNHINLDDLAESRFLALIYC